MADSKDMRDWAANAWGNVEKRREEEKHKNAALVAEEALKKRETPVLWSQARETMRAMCEAFNKSAGTEHLIWDSERGYQAIIRIAPSSRSFSAIFYKDSFRIVLSGPRLNATYAPVVRGGTVLFSGEGRESTAEELAKRFLDHVVSDLAPE